MTRKPCQLTELDTDAFIGCLNGIFKLVFNLIRGDGDSSRLRLGNTIRSFIRLVVIAAVSRLRLAFKFDLVVLFGCTNGEKDEEDVVYRVKISDLRLLLK